MLCIIILYICYLVESKGNIKYTYTGVQKVYLLTHCVKIWFGRIVVSLDYFTASGKISDLLSSNTTDQEPQELMIFTQANINKPSVLMHSIPPPPPTIFLYNPNANPTHLYTCICYGECDKFGDYAYSPVIMYNSMSYWGM